MVERKFGLAAGKEFTEAGAEHNSGLKPGNESDDDDNDYDHKIMMMMVMKIRLWWWWWWKYDYDVDGDENNGDNGDDCDVPGVTFVNRPLARQLHISNRWR